MVASFSFFEFAILLALLLGGGSMFLTMQRRRHAERLHSIKAGRPLPEGKGWQALTCIAIGAVVPLFCLGLAGRMITTHHMLGIDDGVVLLFVMVLVVIGVGGLVAGTLLAFRLLGPRDRSAFEKPPFDPEALDAVDAYAPAGRHV